MTTASELKILHVIRRLKESHPLIIRSTFLGAHTMPKLYAAYAMGIEGICGSICRGKMANVFITKELPGYASLPYYFGSNLIETVILDGKIIS